MMQLVAQHTAHETDDFAFELDEYRDAQGHQMLLAHLKFTNWSPGALKRCIRDWRIFRQHITAPLFGSPMDHEGPALDRWCRFVELMGWRPFTTVLCHDGIERPLYIHTV